mmetsp:Transcript_19430/g.22211  ORF Transcript_19430/g.22211 Transcript_19430/m.22211 type:complete len:231 (-) Transcript_19430:206-898(-)
MMAPRATGIVLLFHVSILVLCCFRCDDVTALQSQSSISSSKMMTAASPSIRSDGLELEILPSPRRRFLSQISKITATVATATIMSPHPSWAAAAPAESARTQWRQTVATLDDLLQNWSTEEWAAEIGGGDKIRMKLGTQGATSPLYQIEKALKVLRDSEFVADFVEFQETADEFTGALYRADSLASSSNNKTGSGKQTPPAVFIGQAKTEVVEMQRIAKKLNGMEPLLMH